MQKKNRTLVIGAVVLAVLVAAMALVYVFTRPATDKGDKTLSIQIVYDRVDKTVEIHTDAEYLGEALEQENLIQGEQGQYGIYIKAVDGRQADGSQQEWWCITKGGEIVMTGADETPIADGDTYELTLKKGY